jgi:hypothetical protein
MGAPSKTNAERLKIEQHKRGQLVGLTETLKSGTGRNEKGHTFRHLPVPSVRLLETNENIEP